MYVYWIFEQDRVKYPIYVHSALPNLPITCPEGFSMLAENELYVFV